MKVTLSDVANEAGVSLATVSVVLSGSERIRISEQTKQLVFQVANQLGYKAKKRKSKKKENSAKKIAFVCDQLDQDIFMKAILGAQETAMMEGYAIYVIQEAALQDLSGFDGIIYSSIVTQEIDKPDLPKDVPVTLLNCWCKEDVDWPSIIPGDLTGGFLVTDHLLSNGAKRVAFLGGESWMEANQSRLNGYKRALNSQDILIDEELIINCDWRPQKSYVATKKLMSSSNPPDAIFSASDRMVIGIYTALKELGIRIPEDVKVAGYDDSELATDLIPSLTSYFLPYFDMGQAAVNTLLQMIAGQEPVIKRIKYESELRVRSSSEAT